MKRYFEARIAVVRWIGFFMVNVYRSLAWVFLVSLLIIATAYVTMKVVISTCLGISTSSTEPSARGKS